MPIQQATRFCRPLEHVAPGCSQWVAAPLFCNLHALSSSHRDMTVWVYRADWRWPQSYAFCYVNVQKNSNKNSWTQRAFKWKP